MAFEHVLFEVRNQIGYVTFNRPESMNAVNRKMAAELVEACKQIEDDAKNIHMVLAPDGICLIADPDRLSARPFRGICESLGLNVENRFARAGEPGGERTKGTIYRITHWQRA